MSIINRKAMMCSAIAISMTLCGAPARADLLIHYTFDEAGSTVTNQGVLGNATMYTNMVPSDLHSPDGFGVSWSAGDRCFDNSSAPYNNAASGVVQANYTIAPFRTYTFTAWVKKSGFALGANARYERLFRFYEGPAARLDIFGAGADAGTGNINVAMMGISVESAKVFSEINQWMFIAITYDGEQTTDTSRLRFYKGFRGSAVSLVDAKDMGVVEIALSANSVLSVGNQETGTRALVGDMDDVRLYNEVLSLSDLEEIRAKTARPDPPELLVHYQFNETGSAVANAGALGDSVMFDSNGNPADLHSPDAEGVTGLPGDRCFNPSAQVMGGWGGVVRTHYAVAAFSSYTFVAWLKPAEAIGVRTAYPRLLHYLESVDSRLDIMGGFGQAGRVNAKMNAQDMESPIDCYLDTGEWFMMAISYDGEQGDDAQRVKFYKGARFNPAELVGTADASVEVIDLAGWRAFAVGNAADRNDRAFDGCIDEVRLYTRVLSLEEIESLRYGLFSPPTVVLVR